MSKLRSRKPFIRSVHFQAFIFFIVYSVVSKTILIGSAASSNLIISFFVPYVFGVVTGMVFLYFFSHEDFFHFIKEVEKREHKKENDYLRRYKQYGSIIATFIIATIGGPILAALTIRLLLNNFRYKYLLISLTNIPAIFLIVAIAKGLVKLIF